MSTERAIIEFVTTGAAEAESVSDKITADLTTAEKAGKSAKESSDAASEAAREAQKEARALATEIRHTTHALHAAVEIAKQLASTAGVDSLSTGGIALEAGASALSGAGRGARAGAFLGPEGAVVGAGIGALAGLVSSLKESAKKLEERDAKVEATENKNGSQALVNAMLRQVGLHDAGYIQSGDGSGRLVQ